VWTVTSQDVQLAPVFSIVVEPRALFRAAVQLAKGAVIWIARYRDTTRHAFFKLTQQLYSL
jgi:hypothetical protein